MIAHDTAPHAILALVALAGALTLAAVVVYAVRIRRAYRRHPGLKRAMRIRAKYRGQG